MGEDSTTMVDGSGSKKWPGGLRDRVSESKNDRIKEERSWDLSLLFLSGNQWLTYDENLRQYELTRPRRGQQTRVTVNLLINVYRNILSRLSVAYPSVVVLPASPSPEDIVKAKSSEIALQYWWQSQKVKDVIEKGIEHLLTCGTTAFHTFYNPESQDVEVEAISPYDLFFEPKVTCPDMSEWIAIRRYHTKDELIEAYPDHKDDIEKSAETSESAGEGTLENRVPENRLEVFEFYWKDGRHAIVLGSTYLFKEDKVPGGIFPVKVVRYTQIPMKLWGMGLIAPLIDLQWYFNKGRSQILQNVEMMGNPKWLIPKSAGISSKSITNVAGEKVYYNMAGGKPEMIAPVPIPSYMIDNLRTLQAEIMDVAGVHSVTMGKRAVGVTSGKAINALAERDLSQLQMTQSNIEKGTRDIARCALVLMSHFYKEKKMVSMLDNLGSVVWKELKGTNIIKDPEVFLESGSLFRHESGDRDQKVLEMLQMGLIPPDQALKELSFRTGNAHVAEKVQALSHAEDILEAAKKGFAVEIFNTDDISAFKKVFGDFMKTDEYYKMPPERQQYVADIFISLETQGMPDEAYQQAMLMRKVFPRQQMPNAQLQQKLGAGIVGQSPMTDQQVQGEQMMAQQMANAVTDVDKLAKGSEALMPKRPNTMGGIG
ncbi:MAG: hypothetical protein CMI60_19640 [Parvibaculum sp.]|nr:hypothetical protein [Parvibaculum sp.]